MVRLVEGLWGVVEFAGDALAFEEDGGSQAGGELVHDDHRAGLGVALVVQGRVVAFDPGEDLRLRGAPGQRETVPVDDGPRLTLTLMFGGGVRVMPWWG